MSASSDMPLTVSVSRRLWAVGFLALVPNTVLAARLVWEQTALTWQEGPQMVGFALAHGLWSPLMLSPALLLVLGAWLLALAAVVVWHRRRPSRGLVALGSATLVVIAALALPYQAWQGLFATRLMSGPYAGELMTTAAALGQRRTVKSFLENGATLTLTDRDGKTALHAAAIGNQPQMIDLLLTQGSPINAIDRFGDSPLQSALGNSSTEAAERLQSRGAQRIQGTAEQRERVIAENVAQNIARINRHRPSR